MEKKEPTMRKILKFLLNNTMVEFTSKEIAKNIKRTGISYHTSRLKAFILDNTEASDILQVRVAKKRESVFMCKAKAVDNPDEWAVKLYKEYLAWERDKNVGGTKSEVIAKPKEDKEKISVPVSFAYNNGEPVEIPINLKINIAIAIVNQP